MTTEGKYQLLPQLSEDEYQSLKADIAERGVQVPVEYDDAGNILDGHHRVRACLELGIKDWPSIVRGSMTEEQKIEHVLSLNLNRRHLTREQRRELVIKLRKQGWSLRRIAERLGASLGTVAGDAEVFKNEHLGHPLTITGADGKQYPAAKPKTSASVFAPNNKDRNSAIEALHAIQKEAPELLEKFASGEMTIPKAKKYLRKRKIDYERRRLAERAISVPASSRWSVEVADIRNYNPGRKFDFIITDPPYPKEYLPMYDVLARRSLEWLKLGGLLVVMCGQSYLDTIYQKLSRHLVYYWTAAYMTPEQSTPLRHRQVNAFWKPILIYANGQYTGKIFGDVFQSGSREKDLHEWQQSVSGMLSIVKQICLPGQWILDPFCGSGTTGVAALRHGCLFHGIDIDESAVKIARSRLHDACNVES